MRIYCPRAIALTGATGQLGRAWLRTVAAEHPDVQLRLLVRGSSPALRDPQFLTLLKRFRSGVTLIEADLGALRLNAAQITALTSADGGLWHFAANTNLSASSDRAAQQAHEVNGKGTAALLAICEASPPNRFFHLSTAYVAGRRTGRVCETELHVNGPFRNRYEQSKAEAEQAVRDAFARGLRGAIFRPSLVLEDDDAQAHSLAHLFATAVALSMRHGSRELTLRCPPDAAMNMVSEPFVITAMLQLAAETAGGTTYHLTARKPMTFAAIGEMLNERVPGFRLAFAPGLRAAQLDRPSQFLDRVFSDLHPYLTSDIMFDRTHTDRAIGDRLPSEIDWPATVERRLTDVGLIRSVAA